MMMAPPAKESHYPHPQPLPTKGRGAHRVRTALDFALAAVKYRVRTDETPASDTTYVLLLTENWDGPGRIGRDRLRVVATWSVRGSASFVRGRHVAPSVRHECAALHRAVDRRASKVGCRAVAVRLWRLRGEGLIRRCRPRGRTPGVETGATDDADQRRFHQARLGPCRNIGLGAVANAGRRAQTARPRR